MMTQLKLNNIYCILLLKSPQVSGFLLFAWCLSLVSLQLKSYHLKFFGV